MEIMERKTILLYYFSGTGNSKRIAELTAAEFASAGFEIAVRNIENGLAEEHDSYAIHGFTAPVYGFGLPAIVARFMPTLPRAEGKSAFVLISRGAMSTGIPGYEGAALAQGCWSLRRKGYKIIGGQGIDMPANWTAVVNPPSGDNAEAIYAAAEETVCGFVVRVLRGDHRPRFAPPWPGPIAGPIYYALAPIAAPTSFFFGLFGHRFLGKVFSYDNNCNSCGLCARYCPVGAVKLRDGHPVWNWNCEQCMRCLNLCPQRVIHVSLIPVVTAIALTSLPIGAGKRVTQYLPPQMARIPLLQPLVKFGTDVLAYIVTIKGVAALHSAGQRYALFRQILKLTSMTQFFGRYREPHFRVADLVRKK